MQTNTELSQEKKLTVLCRVEPGCLGPDGKDHIEGFCRFALMAMQLTHSAFIHWVIIPRYDKTLPEIQYQVNDRNLSDAQAAKYLILVGKNASQFTIELDEKLARLIELYLEKHT
jgi:hypothetical protein